VLALEVLTPLVVFFFDFFGKKKTLSISIDRDKTKNKHYEQTLIFKIPKGINLFFETEEEITLRSKILFWIDSSLVILRLNLVEVEVGINCFPIIIFQKSLDCFLKNNIYQI
jgi:hypothetical protein